MPAQPKERSVCKLINNSFMTSLVVALGLGMAAGPAAAAPPKSVQRLAPQSTPQRQALTNNYAKAKPGNAALSGAVPKTTFPQRNYSFVPGGGVPGKSAPSTASSGKGTLVQGGGVPGRLMPRVQGGGVPGNSALSRALSGKRPRVQGGGVPGKLMPNVQSGGVPGTSLLQSLRDAKVSPRSSGLLGTETGNGGQLPSGLNPQNLTGLDRLRGVKDPSAALKAALKVPVDAGSASQGGGDDPAKETNFADLIAESQGRTTTGNQDAGAGKSTAPWSRARELAQQQASAVRDGVAQGLAELGIRDTRAASGEGGAPYGAPGGAGSSEPGSGSYETPGAGSAAAQFNNPRDANIDETTRLAEASLWFPGMTTGPSLDDFANGGDPRTERKKGGNWVEIVEFTDEEGATVTNFGNGIFVGQSGAGGERQVWGAGDPKKGKDPNLDGKPSILVDVKGTDGKKYQVYLPKDRTKQAKVATGFQPRLVSPNGGAKKKDDTKKNPNPNDDDVRGAGGEISEEWLRGFHARMNGMKDPANEDGRPQHDVDKLIGVTVARIMSTVNPILDGPIGSGGAAPPLRNDLVGPKDPSTAPGRGGTKGPKPGITSPLGPPRRALEMLSGQSDVAASGVAASRNGGLLSNGDENSDAFDPANPQQGNSMP
jgi:hypothetical protein